MRACIHQSETVIHEANGALNSIQFALELLVGQWPGQEANEQVRKPLTEAARAAVLQVVGAESGAGTATDALRLARAVAESEAAQFQIDNNDGSRTVFRFLCSGATA